MNPRSQELADLERDFSAHVAKALPPSWRVRASKDRAFVKHVAIERDHTAVVLTAASLEGVMLFEIKALGPEQSMTTAVLTASSAVSMRRSIPSSSGNNRAILFLLADDTELEFSFGFGDDALPARLRKLGRRLTSKSGFDAVVFAPVNSNVDQFALVVKSGFSGRYSDLSNVLEVLSHAVYAKPEGPRTLPQKSIEDIALALVPSSEVGAYEGATSDTLLQGDYPAGQLRVRHARLNKFLLVADEWNAGKGGITSFNRELALALVQAGKEVCVYLPQADDEVSREAGAVGIDIAVPASLIPGISGASALLASQLRHSRLENYAPDVIIGHGRILGPHAYYVQGLFGDKALRVHIVHTNPELLELAKEGDGGEPRTRIASERRQLEVALAKSANVVAGVGPNLFAWIADDLIAIDAEVEVIQINPGLRDWGVLRDPATVPAKREFLLVGRIEDFESKGVELAIRALGVALQERPHIDEAISLVLRGVPTEHKILRDRVTEIAEEYSLDVVFREYSDNVLDVKTDIRKAIAVMMPSPHEGFGLSAFEAIAMGTPVIISKESGLSQMLSKLRSMGKLSAVPMMTSGKGADGIDRWAALVGSVLDAPEAALREARVLHDELTALDLWPTSIAELFTALDHAQAMRAK
ncbi:glycosyltransferase [Clavibacter michiganensis]|uniref:glycosyltransferase family 4 protein n=1 Tax=Clavibacter michiganensis TaxID=28447 RepID=UPI001365BD51|nr:glycosyltransferase family 4 protein [Clavibacter michiganensis]MDO4040919.1 glycosyltransferase [Clavibacter michiganensis]MDO4060250.1 glycosyltransferase [Clavibacter michiganensis]MDO4077817.1 glycosyltransferase [Clavibacter michiganensis]MDO4093289.1 glycosyltransferase [Clavibacter michiganensis]MDO4102777.1 glycosyltransferase [Clavibacter michiganensis]